MVCGKIIYKYLNGVKMYYKPVGTTIQLMDGRVLKKNQQNLWEDINTGVAINEQTLNFMITHPSFSSDASSGGGSRRTTAPAGPSTSLSAPFDDILANNSSEVQNTQRSVESSLGALTIRLNFSSGVYNGLNGSLLVYKDDVLIDTISVSSRPTQDGTGLYVLSQTFDGNFLKFGFLADEGGNNFDVTVEKTAPGGLVTMDTFNVSSNYSS